MTLNTLNDLKDNEGLIHYQRLKAEAIKWVKAFDLKMEWANHRMINPFHVPKPERELTKEEVIMLQGIYEQSFRVGMMKFYDITEEDLK